MADLSGRTLGKYRLIERLGRGGMAEVYRAFQPGLERDVAVKVMHGYLADDEEFVGRFRREAKAVAALHHPHIVQVYDFDIEDDAYYMVMEYVSGQTLKERLETLHSEGERVPSGEVARIFRALCDALDYAHSRGCLHRDIKPANIMFDDERLVLTDFGIAAIVGGTRLTASGAMIGTPAYMSPEQAQGVAGGEQSDVYSLGVILYEMITGQVPYDADTPLAVVLKHVNEPLPMPTRVDPLVSPAVERVILKALAKSPADRFQSAGALADALETAVAGIEVVAVLPVAKPAADTVVPAPPATTPAPARKRRVWPFVAAAVAVVAVIAAAFVILPALEPGSGEPSEEAVAHFEAGIAALEVWEIEEALDAFSMAIEEDPDYAEAYYMRGLAYYDIDQYETAVEDLTRAIELQPDMADAYFDRGSIYLYDLERKGEALEDFTTVIELDPGYVDAYYERARAYLWYADDTESALADLEHLLALDPDYHDAWALRGELHYYNDEYELAISNLTRAAEISPDEPWTWEMLGFSYSMTGAYEEAINSINEAIRLDPSELEPYYDRAFVYMALGDPEAALEDFDRILLVSADFGGAHYGRGRAYVALGRYEEAIVEFTAVIESGADDYSWPYFEDDSPYIDRAMSYHAIGQTDQALADLDLLLEEDDYWYLPYYYRGLIYSDVGLTEEAIADFRMVWELAPDEEWQRVAEEQLQVLQE